MTSRQSKYKQYSAYKAMTNQRLLHNVIIPGDTQGTGWWRFISPVEHIWNMAPGQAPKFTITNDPVCNPQFLLNVDSIMVQRCITKQQLDYLKWLAQLRDIVGFRIIYNIDDAMGATDIPKFNKGRRAFLSKETQANIKEMLNLVDEVLVTTDYLKSYYVNNFGVNPHKVRCVPNLLPRSWIGLLYDEQKRVQSYRHHKKDKVKVLVCSSMSHYNIDKLKQTKDGKAIYVNKINDKVTTYSTEDNCVVTQDEYDKAEVIPDEMDLLMPVIKATYSVLEWNIVGYANDELTELAKQGKVKVHQSLPITMYPHIFKTIDPDVWVVPLLDLEFNKCKSDIKWLEACAAGIPLLASKISPVYTRHMPDSQLWTSADDLKQKLIEFTHMSAERYQSIVKAQWTWLNSPAEEVGYKLKNWWLEDNIDVWLPVFAQPQRMTQAKADQMKAQVQKMMQTAQLKEVLYQSKTDPEVQILK